MKKPKADDGLEESSHGSEREERSKGSGRSKSNEYPGPFTTTFSTGGKRLSHNQVAINKANERLERDLRNLGQDVCANVFAETNNEEWDQAVKSEMNRPGSGLNLLLESYRLNHSAMANGVK